MKDKTLRRFPDFLGIGANRGGSSWLYWMLAHHPEVWVPPLKEIHYFDRPNLGRRSVGMLDKQALVRMRDYLNGDSFRTTGDGLGANILWDLHYLLVPRGDLWYKNLFRPHTGQVTGELTPAYGILDEQTVQNIRRENPRLKVLFLVRHPLERGWSSLVNNLARKQGRNIAQAGVDEMKKRIDARGFQLRSDYARTITLWRSVFGEDQLFVGFMEDVKADPAGLMRRVCEFLGVPPMDQALFDSISRSVNSSKKFGGPMPEEVRRYMALSLLEKTQAVNTLLQSPYTAAWLESVRAAAGDPAASSPPQPDEQADEL